MRSKLATVVLVGAVGLSGAAGVAALVPAVSYAATGTATTAGAVVSRFSDALSGLVTDGTITQAQADKVASTLEAARPDHGPGGHRGGPGGGGPGRAAAAKALGITEDELRTRTRAGETLADIADAEGVPQAGVVAALVETAKAHLAEEVAEGDLTQAQADERAATLTERITARLDQPFGHGPRGGQGEGGGHGHGRGAPNADGPDADGPDAEDAPSPAPGAATPDSSPTPGAS